MCICAHTKVFVQACMNVLEISEPESWRAGEWGGADLAG